MYRVFRYVIKPSDTLFEYCNIQTHLSCNLYNASLFLIRQMLTYFQKSSPTTNEQNIFNEIQYALPGMNNIRAAANVKRAERSKQQNKTPIQSKAFEMPDATHCLLSYNFLEALMKETRNPDYLSALPRHAAQTSIKRACQDVKITLKLFALTERNPPSSPLSLSYLDIRKTVDIASLPFPTRNVSSMTAV